MSFLSSRRTWSLAAPVLVVGLLQLSGCTNRASAPPPGGVYRSESAGAHFDQSVTVAEGPVAHIASYSLRQGWQGPQAPDTVYLAAEGQGIVRSTDAGKTWTVHRTPLAQVHDVALLGADILIITGTDSEGQGHILRSGDGALSWDIVLTIPVPVDTGSFRLLRQDTPASVVLSIAPDPFDATRIYAGSSLGTVLVGEQGGKTWRTLYTIEESFVSSGRAGLGIRRLIPSPHAADEVLAVTDNGTLIRFSPGGQAELEISRQLPAPTTLGGTGQHKRVYDVRYIGGFPSALFAGVDDGAVISRDAGATWAQLPLPLDLSQKFNTAVVAVSPTNSARLFIGINSVIYRSEDGGSTWNTFSLGLTGHGITEILIHPSAAAQMLVTTTPLRS